MKASFSHKPWITLVIITLFGLIYPNGMTAQGGGCGNITYTLENYEACCYRLKVSNSSECYPQLRLLLDAGSFVTWGASTQTGWTGQLISPTEILLTHSSGMVPIGASTPIGFCLPAGVSPVLTILYDNACPPGKGCFAELPILGCPLVADACISGVKYVDLNCAHLPYTNQPTLSGWTISLLNADGIVLDSAVTNSAGSYELCDLAPGNYVVRETNQPGWSPSVPASGQYNVTLSQSEQEVRNFGNCPACACDSLYMNVVGAVGPLEDTCAYNIVLQNSGAYCFDGINVSLGSGKIASWQVLLAGWTVVSQDSQHLRLIPPGGFVPLGASFPLQLNAIGSAEFAITLSTLLNVGGVQTECKRVFVLPCPRPPEPPCCPAGTVQGPNLVTNGNFQLGLTGFTSQYTLGNFCSPGIYNVVPGSQVAGMCGGWNSLDNTSGLPAGKMLVVDGSQTLGVAAYRSLSFTAASSTQYAFCAYFNNLNTPNYPNKPDPIVQLWLVTGNNVPVLQLASMNLPESPDVWVKVSGLWTSPPGTNSYKLEIRTAGTSFEGNNFAVDDVSIRACSPPPPCQAAFTVTPIGGCGKYQFTSTSTNLPTPVQYCWDFDNNPATCESTLPNPMWQFPTCGTYTVCLTITGNGCISTVCQTVVVTDNVNPVAVCQPGVGVILNANCTYTVPISQIDGGSTDNCQIKSLVVSPAVLTGCQNHTVTLTVTDWCGNTSTCTTGIQTAESVPPTIMCPPNITVRCDLQLSPMFTGLATATDVCSPNPSINYTDVSTGQMPCNGTVIRTWTATDLCLNTADCTQVISVQDNIPPTINCPPNTTVNTLPGVCYYAGSLPPQLSGSDNCRPVTNFTCSWLTPTQSILITPLTQFPKGPNNITCFAQDACGNTSPNCNFILTVRDNQPPVITCPGSMSIVGTVNAQGQCKAVVNGLAPTVTDNCPMVTVIYTITGTTSGSGANDASGTNFMQGISTITYTATDMGNNTATCSFTLNVKCENTPNSIFKCGLAVITCFSGFAQSGSTAVNPNGPVLATVDVRNHASAPLGVNWAAVSSNPNVLGGIYHAPSWNAQNMGQIFGVTIDGSYNVYASSTTMYGRYLPIGLPASTFGNVYKVDATTGLPTVIATLPQNTVSPAGLGDVWYDGLNSQLMVSNFFDGKIYGLNPGGGAPYWMYQFPGVVGSPFFTSTPGFVPLGKRPWAVARRGNKLFFSVWCEDRGPGRSSAAVQNQIYTVQLNTAGVPITGSEVKIIDVPDLVGNVFSSPVSDISFSADGKMLVAQRSMINDFGNAAFNTGAQAHASRILEFSGPTWASMKIFYVGNASNTGNPVHAHSSGGIDYGYESFNPAVTPLPSGCDSMVWGTGDALRFPNYNVITDPSALPCGGGIGDYVYGVTGIRSAGNSNLSSAPNYVKNKSIYVDVDNNLCTGEKIQIGDIDIFKNCITCSGSSGGSFPCDSVMVMYEPVTVPGQNKCCFSIDLKNLVTSPNLTKICANLTTPGWVFNTATVMVAGGWTLGPVGANQICITHQSGSIPLGNLSDVLTFCLAATNPNAPPVQQIIFDWYAGNNIVCNNTMMTDCDPGADKDTCVVISNLKADCFGGNDLEYCMTFTATNLNNIPAYGLILGALPPGYSYGNCGCGGTPYGTGQWLFSGFPIIPANSSQTFCVKIIANAPVLSPKTVCFKATLEFLNKCCTAPKDWCVELKPCCKPCDKTSVSVSAIEGECCYAIDFKQDCDFGAFTHVDFNILTSDVFFGWHANAPGYTFCTPTTPSYVCVQPTFGGTFPPGAINDLFSFCLTDIDKPAEIPQMLQIIFWTTGSNGQDSIACDTILTFNCEYKKDTCLFVTDEKIRCIPDSMKYEITITVTNLSNPNFTATDLLILGPPVISPNPIPFSPAISNGQSGTVTFCYTPSPWPDADGKLELIYRLKNTTLDSCCNGGVGFIDTLMLPPCDTCECGKFTDLFFRPTQGAASVPVMCGDVLTIGCNPQFNPIISGTFMCMGNCMPSGPTQWELRKLPSGTLVASGSLTVPGFSLALLASYFSTAGMFELTLTGQCGGKACPPCKFKINALGCPCQCGTFEQMKIVNKKTGFSQNLTCNGLPPFPIIPLPCPPAGKPYKITGKLVCNPADCKPTNLKWEIKKGTVVVASGTQLGPWFGVTLDNTTFAMGNGVYTVTLMGMCGTQTCTCVYNFEVSGCPMPCPCDNAFIEHAAAGFSYSYDYSMGTCRVIFKPNLATECDKLDWTIQGQNINFNATGSTSFNQTFTVTIPTGTIGNYKVWMRIYRPGTTCDLKFCQFITLNCLVTPTCAMNVLDNSGFNENSTEGILGAGGSSAGWSRRAGSPEIVGGNACNDPFSLKLVGKCSPILVDIVDHPIQVLPKSGVSLSLCYRVLEGDLRPGTQLVVRLSDEPQDSVGCPAGCVEVARLPIDSSTNGEWRTVHSGFYLEGEAGNKFLTLHVENDLAYEDPDANSTVLIDNICFEQDEFTEVPTHEVPGAARPVRIFPNPNPGTFTVELPQSARPGMTFRITDLTGRQVQEKQTEAGSARQTVQTGDLPAGLYFLQVVAEGRVLAVEKFVKQ